MVGADPFRFGVMIERLENSYSVGNNNYPKTFNDAKLYLDRTDDKNKKTSTVDPGILDKMKMSWRSPVFELVTCVERQGIGQRDAIFEVKFPGRSGTLTGSSASNVRTKKKPLRRNPTLRRPPLSTLSRLQEW
jgi:hypothetical protein